MIKPRNTLVVLRQVTKPEQKVGNIVLSDGVSRLYGEYEVVAVGPGMVSAQGGQPETFDLKPGQRVYVKSHKERPGSSGICDLMGMQFVNDGEVLYIFEQGCVLGILAEPGEAEPADRNEAKTKPTLHIAN